MPPSSTANLITLRSQLRTLRDVDPSMALAAGLAFVEVAYSHPEPVSSQALVETLGVVHSGPTRIMDILSREGRRGRNKEGLDLVEAFADPDDRRMRLYRLTEKGRRLAKRLAPKMK